MNLREHRRRLAVEWWAMLLIASLALALLAWDRTTERFDNFAYDRVLQLDTRAPSPEILLVTIDQPSLAEVGRWPWPRDVHARLVDRLAEARPRAIAYDILFAEPSSDAEDAALAAAIARAGNVYLPLSFNVPGLDGAAFDVVRPIAPIDGAAAGTGHVNLSFDPDGLVRSAALRFETYPHLMTLMRARSASGTPYPDAGDVLIPFHRDAGEWPVIPAADILAGKVPTELLRDRLILVGVTADGLGDRHSVPLQRVSSGIEIQAELLDGLLSGDIAAKAGLPLILALTLLPLWALMLVLRRSSSRTALIALLGLIVIVLLTSAGAMVLARIWIPPATALIGLLFIYPMWNWRQLSATEAFMHGELKRFGEEPQRLDAVPIASDTGNRPRTTVEMLGTAMDRARATRRFVSERLDQLPDATFIADEAGQIVLHNEAGGKLLGTLGLKEGSLPDLGALLAHFRASGAPQTSWPDIDALAVNEAHEVSIADGRFFDIRFAPQTTANGESAGWIVRAVDISEAKAAIRQREDILQLLTHDMRSPQASIIAILETARAGEVEPGIASRIRHYAQRTLGLADGFVQLARAETLAYTTEEVSLSDMLLDAIDDLWPQITARNIAIETLGEMDALFISAERSLLTRALINVIGNAVKFSPSGSKITCTLDREIRADGQIFATCAISDQGPGLAPEHRQSIFERFYRGPMGVGREMDGVGLGLSFVHTVTARHNGTIKCDSVPGQGTTFTFAFPTIG